LKAVSLFSGCGGTDIGFSKAGVSIEQAFDIDAAAVDTYNTNLSGCATTKDVRSFTDFPQSLDILIATPPCQGFSTAGGYRHDDPRNSLFITSCEAIVMATPRVAVIENVAAITNKRNLPLLKQGISILKAAGYHVETIILSCDDYGVPQRRKRAFIIARSDSRPFNLCGFSKLKSKQTLSDALDGLNKSVNAHRPSPLPRGSKHEKIARAIKPGQKLCNVRAGSKSVATWEIPEVFGETTNYEKKILTTMRALRRRNRKRDFGDADPVCIADLNSELRQDVETEVGALLARGYLRRVEDCIDLTNTFNGKYRRLDSEESSPTVDTRFGDCQLFLHPTENRGMTGREAARIQGFPDSFEFSGASRTVFRLIGNAVPPPVAERVARFSRELI